MSENRRQAYRYAVATAGAKALLRVSEGEVTVQIVDESAGGYGVECDRILNVNEGELAGFTTTSGQSIVRLVRVEFDEENNLTSIGLQRISEIAQEPSDKANRGLLFKLLGKGAGTVLMLIAFALGLGGAMGFATSAKWLPWSKGGKAAASTSPEIPRDPGQRAVALSKSFNSLDDFKSRQFVAALGITGGQQRKIDTIVDKLMFDLANVSVDRGAHSPETASQMGMMMIRRAWMQVETVLTDDQMTKWDAILDGKMTTPGEGQASL